MSTNGNGHLHVIKWILGGITTVIFGALLIGFIALVSATFKNTTDIRLQQEQIKALEESRRASDARWRAMDRERKIP